MLNKNKQMIKDTNHIRQTEYNKNNMKSCISFVKPLTINNINYQISENW